jgi:RimJ/RimL family protein N-acetyltransferase
MMVATGRIGLWTHLRWFWRVRRSPTRRLYIAVDGRQVIGSTRLDLLGDHGLIAEVDIVIAPTCRQRGYGRAVLAALTAEALALGIPRVRARIRLGNLVSRRAFTAAGYERVGYDAHSRWLILERNVRSRETAS